ncbi:MAG: alpha/beta hydrolase family protein [Ignavibacteriaceae bacterium]
MKLFSVLFLSIISAFNITAQQGTVYENGIAKSAILNEDMRFAIYLPDGYETSELNYPVVYLLHGRTDDHTGWIQFGQMQHIVDKAINEGEIPPMIIVMPDAKLTFYMNYENGSYSYEDYFIKELIPHIEKNYRCRSKKEYRALAGLSMGGFGSLLYALHHPDMFAACSALSSAVRTDEEIINMPDEKYKNDLAPLLGGEKYGKDRISDYYNRNSILYLVKNMPAEQKNAVRFYIDCGDGDFLFKGNSALHVLMREMDIAHEYRVRDGIHEWEYWRTGLPAALKFISKSFHR